MEAPDRSIIPPSDFLGLAEETKLIVHGEWAIRRACMDAMTWPDSIGVSVNLSAVQIENCDFYGVVTEALEATGLEPYRLQLEIPETILMHDRQRTQATLRKLHGLGVKIALDDFGTCFGTLNYLSTFPFKKIKIDRRFVHDVSEHEYSREIEKSVADLASELNLRSLAEGVETGADLAAVRSAGYDEAQGFYFSVPVPTRSVGRIIAQCASKFSAEALGPRETKVAA